MIVNTDDQHRHTGVCLRVERIEKGWSHDRCSRFYWGDRLFQGCDDLYAALVFAQVQHLTHSGYSHSLLYSRWCMLYRILSYIIYLRIFGAEMRAGKFAADPIAQCENRPIALNLFKPLWMFSTNRTSGIWFDGSVNSLRELGPRPLHTPS